VGCGFRERHLTIAQDSGNSYLTYMTGDGIPHPIDIDSTITNEQGGR
jgi:hypothetical protein